MMNITRHDQSNGPTINATLSRDNEKKQKKRMLQNPTMANKIKFKRVGGIVKNKLYSDKKNASWKLFCLISYEKYKQQWHLEKKTLNVNSTLFQPLSLKVSNVVISDPK